MLFLRRKAKGTVGGMIICISTILILGIILMISIDTYKKINTSANLKALERKYMFRLETQGGLSDSDLTELDSDLRDNGVTAYKLNETTRMNNPISYGNIVTLHITGTVHVSTKIRISQLLTFEKATEGEDIQFELYQQSTSKH